MRRCWGAGIIPTRVGTRLNSVKADALKEDHPHACGDKLENRVKRLEDMGSSPRVWGQAGYVDEYSYDSRIIPTRVGTRRYVQ